MRAESDSGGGISRDKSRDCRRPADRLHLWAITLLYKFIKLWVFWRVPLCHWPSSHIHSFIDLRSIFYRICLNNSNSLHFLTFLLCSYHSDCLSRTLFLSLLMLQPIIIISSSVFTQTRNSLIIQNDKDSYYSKYE